jgi:uncharacterized membrane protein
MRILAKTSTYGVMHLTVTFVIALAVSRDIHVALGISLLEPVVQILCFMAHEHIWEKFRPGSADKHHHHMCCAEADIADKIVTTIRKKT